MATKVPEHVLKDVQAFDEALGALERQVTMRCELPLTEQHIEVSLLQST